MKGRDKNMNDEDFLDWLSIYYYDQYLKNIFGFGEYENIEFDFMTYLQSKGLIT